MNMNKCYLNIALVNKLELNQVPQLLRSNKVHRKQHKNENGKMVTIPYKGKTLLLANMDKASCIQFSSQTIRS
jgi:hypothetical protein